MRESIEEQIQPTRRKILETLKKHGGLTADELSEIMGITSMGIRRHLTTLERDGLVKYDVVQRGMGRPSYLYHLTDMADDLFPKTYPQLTTELLGYIDQLEGRSMVSKLFELRTRRRLDNALARFGHFDGAARLKNLTMMLNEEGYMASVHDEGDNIFVLYQHNCPIKYVADQYPCACEAEHTFLEQMLDGTIQREKHAMSGDHCCAYRIELE